MIDADQSRPWPWVDEHGEPAERPRLSDDPVMLADLTVIFRNAERRPEPSDDAAA